ncbi:aldo/keto reductase [Natrarchaeobius chitinivorans]|uniref:Aldo/keto reductase n=1 Tax=Natrarchaeobius chitinivorans TaxID=1679083 RepID=A0A3N6P5X1_NATCH|nr:aldo/keto reductase [Natrarchaeobius chitinivorans]RQG91075.1 aldo/keto reductase [Natrarchaeobius chitinivorans]
MASTPLPEIGLGTMKINDPETIQQAIDIGYRHLDTAQYYENESVVGEGINRADVQRDELFISTKVRKTNLGYEEALSSSAPPRPVFDH